MSFAVGGWTSIMMSRFSAAALISACYLFAAVAAQACDLCGCYTPQMQMLEHGQEAPPFTWLTGWYGGVAEQFTHFGTVQINGNEAPNPAGQYENSSITQLSIGYGLSSGFSLEASLPVI